MNLPGPLALVTGSAAGFGLLTSIELAQAGWNVFATMRDPARRDKIDAAAKAALVQDRIHVERLDVTDQASVDACARKVHEHGPLSVLVNNAGYGLGGFVEDVTLDELRAQFETNFFGLVRVTKAFLPKMRESRGGTIVNVSSVAGTIGGPGLSSYHSSKWAVEGWSESLRHELALFGVRVVLVEPGAFKTDIFERNRRVAARCSDPSSPYFAMTQKLTKYVDDEVVKSAADPLDVAQLIVSIARAENPLLRYPIGLDARVTILLKKLLPQRVFLWAVSKTVAAKLRG
ncbi:MAG: SDR family oxidoreductase [Planctomycetota bacterium]